MKRTLSLLLTLTTLCIVGEALAETVPKQDLNNTKGFAGLNYNRQDSKQVGAQRIVNDHSAFNINIQIIKQGALFQSSPASQDDAYTEGADASLSNGGEDEGK